MFFDSFYFQNHFSGSKIFSIRVLLQKIGVKKHIYLIIDWPFLSIVFCFENDRILRKRQDFSCFEKGSLSSEAWKCFYAPKKVISFAKKAWWFGGAIHMGKQIQFQCFRRRRSPEALFEFEKRCVIYFK